MDTLVAPVVGAPPLKRFAPPTLVKAASPAAGAEFTQAVDDGHWWRLLTFFVVLGTSAAVADRTLRMEYRDEADNVYHVNGNPVTYPASTTAEAFSFSVWHPRGEWEVSLTNLVPLAPVLLQPGHDFHIEVTNIQATDTLTGIRYIVEKFYAPKSAEYDWRE